MGLPAAGSKSPVAAVFDTEPIRFAVRRASVDLDAVEKPGWGVVLWIKAEDPDALCKQLEAVNVPITQQPCDGFCGREFVFEDPDGYQLTVYEG